MISQFYLSLLSFFVVTTLVSAQDITISTVSVPEGNTIEVGKTYGIGVDFTVTPEWSYDDHTGSIELLAGPTDGPSHVVDVACFGVTVFGFGCFYIFPKSLPPGPYHWRANVTNDTIPSSLSDTFQVTAVTFECATPQPWKNITSISDPNYTSLYWEGPLAGDVISIFNARDGGLVISWDYRDARNEPHPNASISDMTMEAVNSKTGEIGGRIPMDPGANVAFTWSFEDNDITFGGWRLRMNYTNKYEGSPLGTPVSALSEVFIVADGGDCPAGLSGGAKAGNGGTGRLERITSAWPSLAVIGMIFYFFL